MVAVLAANMIYDRHFDASIRENMIDRKKLRLRYELASGQFGEVYKGVYKICHTIQKFKSHNNKQSREKVKNEFDFFDLNVIVVFFRLYQQ